MIFDLGAMPVPGAAPLGQATAHGLGQYLDPAAMPAMRVPWSQTAIPQGAAAFGPVTPFGRMWRNRPRRSPAARRRAEVLVVAGGAGVDDGDVLPGPVRAQDVRLGRLDQLGRPRCR